MTTLSDLLSVPSKDDVLDFLIGLARFAGFPVASWQPGSVARRLFEGEAANLADLAASIAQVAKGGLLDSATGAWLDLLGVSVFNEPRKQATFARHTVTLTAAPGAGPYTVTSGAYWVSTPNGLQRFVLVALPNGDTIPIGGSLDVIVQAELAGAAYNATPGTIVEQVTPFVGVFVTNPGGLTGSSIVVQGTDAETDPAYRQRCRDKWSTLGGGSTDGAYRYWATTASPEVTRVKVSGDPATGIVTTVVAGPSGPVTDPAFALVDAAITSKKPTGVRAATSNASAASTPVVATLYLLPGASSANALAAARAAVDAYARDTEIGGTVYRSRIVDALQAAGVRSIDIGTLQPANDVGLLVGTVFVPAYALTAVAT